MRMIHVLRKPLSEGTVAANTLKHGTGGLNIDEARIASPGESIQTHSRSPEASAKKNRPVYGEYGPLETHQTEGQKRGRWPANVILQHLDGCRCNGGTVANWLCEPGCPVARLDEQTGILKSGAMDSIAKGGKYTTYGKMYERRVTNPASEGGASRFYKQIGGEE